MGLDLQKFGKMCRCNDKNLPSHSAVHDQQMSNSAAQPVRARPLCERLRGQLRPAWTVESISALAISGRWRRQPDSRAPGSNLQAFEHANKCSMVVTKLKAESELNCSQLEVAVK